MAGEARSHVRNTVYERWRWSVFGATYLAYAGFYLTRMSFPVAKIGIVEDPGLHITRAALGAVDSAYLIAYAIGQFIWGIAGDKLGPRKVVLAGILLSVIAAFAMGASSIVLVFGLVNFVQGIAQSSGWAPLTKNIGQWFSLRERGRAFGWWGTNYSVGTLVAVGFAGCCAKYFSDWRFAFYVPATALLIIWLAFLIFQRNRPEDVGLPPIEEYHEEPGMVAAVSQEETDAQETVWQIMVRTLRRPMVIRLAMTYFLLKPTRYAILLWGPLIVSERLGTDIKDSSLINVMFGLGGPLGVLAVGYASDKLFGARRIPACVIFLVLLSIVTFFFSAITSGGSVFMMAITLFTIGFLLYGPDSLVVGTAAVDFGTKKEASTAAGMINGFGSASSALAVFLCGVVADRWSWGPVFAGLGICVLLSALLLIPRWNAVPAKEKA